MSLCRRSSAAPLPRLGLVLGLVLAAAAFAARGAGPPAPAVPPAEVDKLIAQLERRRPGARLLRHRPDRARLAGAGGDSAGHPGPVTNGGVA